MDRPPKPPRPAKPFPMLPAAVGAAGMVGVELVLQVFNDTLGLALGSLAAGLLLFSLSPLQVLAHRRLGRAFPPAAAIPMLPEAERRILYREQSRLAWKDGQLTTKERLLLDDLRIRLGISEQDAHVLEAEVFGARA